MITSKIDFTDEYIKGGGEEYSYAQKVAPS